jgi:uncharacterized membrane protein required for colicin V production
MNGNKATQHKEVHMSPYLIIDALIVVIVAFFALRGLRKGLIMALAGVVIFVLALVGAYIAVGIFSPRVEALIEPMIGGWVDNRASERIPEGLGGGVGGMTDSMVFDALQMFGLSESQANRFAESVSGHIDQAGQGISHALTSALTSVAARTLTFGIAFGILMLVLYLAARLLDTIAKLPLLNAVNKLGGLAGGTLHGLFIVWLGVFCLRFLGLISSAITENTYALRFISGIF